MTRSLPVRLLLGFSVVLALALAILALYVGHEDRELLRANLVEDLDRSAALLAATLPRDALRAGDEAALDAWADHMSQASGRRVTVIAPDGRVLGDSEVRREGLARLENHATRPEVRAARVAGTGHAIRSSESVGTELLYSARAVPGVPGAVVRIAMPMAGARAYARRTQRALWTSSALALALGLALAVWGTRPLARRLREIESVAHRVESGDLEARASESGGDELSQVAAMVNRMAAGLRGTIAEVASERDVRDVMLSAMTDGIVLLDTGSRVVHANTALAPTLGIPTTPRPGTPFHEWCRMPEIHQVLAEAKVRGPLVRRELRLRGSGGREVEVVTKRSAGGGVLLVVRDLTPIRHLERVRQDFVANVSHEVKTPLTSILGYAETLLDGGLEDEERRRDFVLTIRDQASRLKAIVDDLLALADLERPDAALHLVALDVGELARSVANALAPRARGKGLELICEVPEGEVAVLGQQVRLEQVLFNLLDNAVKYTERGEVRLRVERGRDEAVIEVSDSGPGIPPEATARIFERFYRLDAARSRAIPGTGLGLSIVRHIVELHGGRIDVDSQLERGSRFTVRLPLASATAR